MKLCLLLFSVLLSGVNTSDTKSKLRASSYENEEDLIPTQDTLSNDPVRGRAVDPQYGPLVGQRDLSSDGRCGPEFEDAICSCEGDDHYCSHWGWCGFSPYYVKYMGFDGQYNCPDPVVMTEINGVRCWTGSDAAVRKSCGEYADCCSGTNACTNWSGDNTVCTGSCTGNEACKGLGQNNVILEGSCTSDSACRGHKHGNIIHNNEELKVIVEWIDGAMCFTGGDDQVTRACSIMNADCCEEEDACSWMGAGESTVCQESCKGYSSCDGLTANTTILPDSCVGDYACLDLGGLAWKDRDTGESVKKKIGPRSCVGEYACWRLGRGTRNYANEPCLGEDAPVLVESDACIGERSCVYFGAYAKWVRVSQNACQGNWACGWEGSDHRCDNTQVAFMAPSDCQTGYVACKDDWPILDTCTDACRVMIEAEEHCFDGCTFS